MFFKFFYYSFLTYFSHKFHKTIVLLLINVLWMSVKFISFIKDPTKYKIVDKVERYTYIQESIMLITVVMYLIVGKI